MGIFFYKSYLNIYFLFANDYFCQILSTIIDNKKKNGKVILKKLQVSKDGQIIITVV